LKLIPIPTGLQIEVSLFLRDTNSDTTVRVFIPCPATGIRDDFVAFMSTMSLETEDFGDGIRVATAEEIAAYKADETPEQNLS
jgi:hypothetical protein